MSRALAAGVPAEMDEACSSIFVPELPMSGAAYGTRSQTVVAVWTSGTIEAHERSLAPAAAAGGGGPDSGGWEWQSRTLKSSLV